MIESRRKLLEHCGAAVITARGSEEALQQTLHEPVDLVLIDATNIGVERGEKLCGLVKRHRPHECVAMLIQPELDALPDTEADRVIHRSGPGKILVEINEMLDGRLDINLWEGQGFNEDQDRSTGKPE